MLTLILHEGLKDKYLLRIMSVDLHCVRQTAILRVSPARYLQCSRSGSSVVFVTDHLTNVVMCCV